MCPSPRIAAVTGEAFPNGTGDLSGLWKGGGGVVKINYAHDGEENDFVFIPA